MKMFNCLAGILFSVSSGLLLTANGQEMQRLSYNNPDLLVDLGVGLWAWPLPMDYNDDGLPDLVVVCTDTPYSGVYYFENTGVMDSSSDLPVFKPSLRIGDALNNVSISYVDGKPVVTTPGNWYPDFRNSVFKNPVPIPAPDVKTLYFNDINTRAYQWQFVDYDHNGTLDLMVGIGVWGPRDHRGSEYYGWDNAYDRNGQWQNGPLHGYIYIIKNEGSNENPEYKEPVRILTADGAPLDVYGRPSPNYSDFNGDGVPDILCGEFRDGFTFFENVGSEAIPLFKPGRLLTKDDRALRMDLCMITPVAFDFNGDGWSDLIVGDEDGRVALVQHSGKVVDGMPVFLPPRYFRQKADQIKFGALATPVGYDWNGDGLEDILVGNTAGNIAYIQNLGGDPVAWAAPVLLQAGGEVIRIQAGPNGSIQGPAEAKWGYTTFTVADWNHDGLPDLVVNSIWGKVIWFENTGTHTQPRLAKAQPVQVEWPGKAPKPEWNWWNPLGNELVTQWRTTPVATDWTGDGLTDLVMLDHEGYLSLFRRAKKGERVVLLPGERIFRLKGEEGPLRLNDRTAGGSGRRKISIVDFDDDGRPDFLVNSQNASFFRNIGEENGMTILEDMGLLGETRLAGHSSSPTTIDILNEGIRHLLVGAEDGYLYFKRNPFVPKAK